jgi:chromosome partitioning protein
VRRSMTQGRSTQGRCVVAVVGRKGGAGKTTTALNLAGALVEAGYIVHLIDLDPQQSLSRLASNGKLAISVMAVGSDAEAHAAQGDVVSWLRTLLPPAGFVVIDTPPHLGNIMDAAIAVADLSLLPTRLAQQDIDSLLDTLERCPSDALIIPNAVSTRRRIHKEMIASLRAAYPSQIAARHIPDSGVVEEALNTGVPVVHYARRSAPAAAYRALAEEVVG